MGLQEIKHAGAAIRRAVAIRPALNPPSFFQRSARNSGSEAISGGEGRRFEASARHVSPFAGCTFYAGA